MKMREREKLKRVTNLKGELNCFCFRVEKPFAFVTEGWQ